jgi:hypothetical protein
MPFRLEAAILSPMRSEVTSRSNWATDSSAFNVSSPIKAVVLNRTMGQRPLNAALDGLMMHTQSMSYRKERGVLPVGQQHPRPLDPARRLRSRPRYRNQPRHIFISDRQFNRLPPCCHDLQPRSCESEARVQAVMDHVNPAQMDQFQGIDELIVTCFAYIVTELDRRNGHC